MLNHGTLQNPDLHYVPLPEDARRAALDAVSKQGFTPLEHFKFSSFGENQSIKTNVLAFAHPIHRTPEYTGITVLNAANGHEDNALVQLLARSAAPFHIIHRDEEFSLWRCPVLDKVPTPRPIEAHISYDQLENVLIEYEVDLQPQRIIDVKQGRDTFTIFRDIQPLQLSLWAAEVTGSLLVKHFAATVARLRELLNRPTYLNEEERDQLVTTLSIQLLGAIILADTGVLGDEIRLNRPSLNTLMQAASKKFKRYFRYEMFLENIFEADQAYQLLQQICYAGFVPDMLRELYRTAYTKKERKESGSYDTPLYLTRRIWKNIPVEYLSPESRVVADMTCGWGSFLVAGYERLSSLKDMESIILREQLYGNDSADFTAQLAGLGLLLSTSEDSWNIHSSDALQWSWLREHQPSLIVGNPPFEGDRKKSSSYVSSLEEKGRYEKANAYLEHAIQRLAPGGYLAMLMPSSFTVSEASPDYRKQLLEYCDVLELWDIPSGVFDAEVQTVVVFARKKSDPTERSHHPVRVRTIQRYTLENTEDLQTFTTSGLVTDQSAWNEQARKSKGSTNTHIMDYKIILPDYSWQAILASCNGKTLCDVAEVFRGATVGQKPEKKRWRNYPYPKTVQWLSGIRNVMPANRPWWINYNQSSTIMYPSELKEPLKSKNPERDKERFLAGVKVLVPYDVNPSWGKRARVAIERKGYYVSDHFYVIVPTSLAQEKHITHEVVAAVLNWDVSNAWIVEHLKNPAIPKRIMDTVPFPEDLSEEDCRSLTQAVLQLESAADSNLAETMEAMQTIDTVLKKAYHLDDATFARLRQVKEWNSKPQITLDPPPVNDEANCFISGVVDSINAAQGTITLWLKGFNELQIVQIAPSMPGWMLRPGIAFRTEIPRQYTKQGIIDTDTTAWGTFRPQPYTYMSEEELLGQFTSLLR
jgi:N-6 DNA Methylase